jgi:ribosomal protein S18 acetylase RimI-like enzyme
MKFSLRAALKADLPGLLRLVDQIQQQHAERIPEEFLAEPNQDGLRDFLQHKIDNENQVLLVAEQDEALVGYLWCEIQHYAPSLFRPARSQLYIQHVCVDELCRRQGIATALFEQVDICAKNNDISKVGLDTWVGNDAAQAFFRRQGFEMQQLKYSKRLG